MCILFPGIVVSNRPLRTNEVFQVKVNKLNERWTSSFSIGLIGFSPDSVHLPITAVGLKRSPAVVLRSVIITQFQSSENYKTRSFLAPWVA